MSEEKKSDIPPDLFKDVIYYIVGDINKEVINMLDYGGAKRDMYLSEMVNHVIADDVDHMEYHEAKDIFELPCVMSDWVILSVKCKIMLDKDIFMPDGKLFSGIVACPAQLEDEDFKKVWAMIVLNGGRCLGNLTSRCSHLITASTEGTKYEAAMTRKDKVKVVTPDWITESIQKGSKQEEKFYHPTLIVYPKPESPPRPPQPEPMEVSPGNQELAQLPALGSDKAPTSEDVLGIPRSDTPSAKEALARKIVNKLHKPRSPKSPGAAHGRTGSPSSAQGGKKGRKTPPGGLFYPHPEGGQLPPQGSQKLRNITNNFESLKATGQKNAANKMLGPHVQPPPGLRQPPPPYFMPPMSHMPPPYWGHDPTDSFPPSMCLLGCIFYITDYQKILGPEQISKWKQVIEQYGGQVDPSYSNRVTHVMCATQQSDVFLLALRDQRRVVTAFWLNDVLLKREMRPPWQALHLPLMYGDEKPCKNQLISVTNFEDDKRTRVKQMISAIGAKYTGYMTRGYSALVCRRPEGIKYQKAKEWKIPVVNVQWLSDLILGHMEALQLPIQARYLQVGQEDEFQMDLNKVTHLMVAWRTPLKIPKEIWKKFKSRALPAAGQENISRGIEPVQKKQKLDTTQTVDSSSSGPRVLFTGYPKGQMRHLQQIVTQFGGTVVENPRICTHLIANSFSRTMKFFVAINVCHHIVNHHWLEDSQQQNRFLDESPYGLRDPLGEAEMKCSLAQSLARARHQPLFGGMTFYITPGVQPPICDLSHIIESAGGTVSKKKRLAAKTISSLVDEKGKPTYIVLTCSDDHLLFQDLVAKNIPVFNAEFVLSGIMKQELNFNAYQIPVQ